MPEVALTESERLTDRLLAEQAARVTDQIARLRAGHQADVLTFIAGVGARAGVDIPLSAQRIERDGAVLLSWPDAAPAPAADPAPAAEPTPEPAPEPRRGRRRRSADEVD